MSPHTESPDFDRMAEMREIHKEAREDADEIKSLRGQVAVLLAALRELYEATHALSTPESDGREQLDKAINRQIDALTVAYNAIIKAEGQ